MTTQMKSLLFAAAIAILPVACGTSSPMGTDLAGLEAGATVSGMRIAPPVPPQAPEELPSNVDPMPAEPEPDPNAHRPNRPVTEPSLVPFPMPPAPNTEGPVVVPAPSNAPPTTVPNSGPSPAPSNGDTPNQQDPAETEPVPAPGSGSGNVPAPSDPGSDPADVCAPVSIQITQVTVGQRSEGLLFMATLSNGTDSFVEDPSCEKLTWAAVGRNASSDRAPVIAYDANSRIVSITGLRGLYTISATAPNGVSGVLAIDVQ